MYLALTEPTWLFIIGQSVIVIGMVVKAIVDANNRRNDRLDKESEAKIRQTDKDEIIRATDDSRNEVLKAGDVRKAEIIKETKQVKTVAVSSMLKSEKAIQACNDVTNKFNATVEVAKQTLEKVNAGPVQVEVMNTPDHRIPTEQVTQ